MNPSNRLLTLAVALVVGLFSMQPAGASVVSSAKGADHQHGQDCQCGTKCRGSSCCCGPKRSKVPKPAPKPVDDRSAVGLAPGLCMGAAPCGDAGLPGRSASTGSVDRMAAISFGRPPGDPMRGRFFHVSRRCILPDPHASRLDEPPEGTTAA